MLKTRVITAVVLLAILLPVLFLQNMELFGLVVLAFFGAALWEAYRLVQPASKYALVIPIVWALVFAAPVLGAGIGFRPQLWWGAAVAVWALLFVPLLAKGLPAIESSFSRVHGLLYMMTLVAAFMAITVLYQHSPVYLLSVMAIVWVADIGAYFAGKAFGKHKLAPSISPGKSSEGAIGGALAVLVLFGLSAYYAASVPWLADTFAAHVLARRGWPVLLLVLVVLVAASIAGDLAESQLKRRAGMKDSSNLLPGHGGVLDRIDALVPVLPLAALIDAWL
ncbi:MAG: phosphatidate cytidylyltransferase [Telluria sp.]